MDYKQFMDWVAEEMRARFPGADISIQEVSKLQGQSYTGMSVRLEDSDIAATLDLKPFYEGFESDLAFDDVMDLVEHTVASAIRHLPHYDANTLTDYDQMKDTLVIQLVPVAGNEQKLSQIPHRRVEDMALVYRFELENNVQGSSSILLTNDMLTTYGITADRLHADALKAAVKNHPAKLRNMNDIMREIMGDMSSLLLMEEPSPMWIATLDNDQYGAGVIQYPGFLDQAAERLGGDFYVLPSSIHEVLLVADDGSMELSYLEETVKRINETEVAPEDRLSYTVYHYDSAEHIFENARTFEAREARKEAAILSDAPFEQAHAPDTITVLLVEPGEHPKVVQIGTGLENLQKAVGGDIEVVYPYEDPVGLIVNEEGKINGLQLNRALRDEDNEIYDIVAGSFLVAGLTEDNFGSLSEEQIRKFESLFHQPEVFVRMGRRIMAFPIPEEVLQSRNAARAAEALGEKSRSKGPEHDGH